MQRLLKDSALLRIARRVFRKYGLPDDIGDISRRPLPAATFKEQVRRSLVSGVIIGEIKEEIELSRREIMFLERAVDRAFEQIELREYEGSR